jgi:hypothetical protein
MKYFDSNMYEQRHFWQFYDVFAFHSHKRDGNHNTPFTCHGLFLSLAYKRTQTITNLFLSRSLHCTCIKETTDHNTSFTCHGLFLSHA